MKLGTISLALAAGCTGNASDPPPNEVKLAEIQSLRLQGVRSNRVTVTWELGAGSAESVEVLRDGDQVVVLDTTERRYVDRDIVPGQKYRYALRVIVGSDTSEAESLVVDVPTPPVAQARLDGDYTITFVVLESTLGGDQSNPPGRWELHAQCQAGPCDSRLRSLSGHYSLRLAFLRGRARYQGLGIQRAGLSCNGVDEDARKEISLRVTGARMVGDTWTATRFTGTIETSDVEDSPCLPALARVAVRGRLKGITTITP